ncbi:hypothetical protein KDL29_14325 [bacterium]|nr:hypothetical protein [bacterium]
MHRTLTLLIFIALLAASCGGSATPGTVQQAAESPLTGQLADNGSLPEDGLLPWESLNENGFVDPATARRSTAINENSEFWRGVDAWQTAGSTTATGQALRLDSGSAGSGERSSATYRIPLAGENPAILSTDINLRSRDDDSASEFFISIANFSSGRWDWFGPFSDGRVRMPLSDAATGDYISGLGNAFVSVVAYSGSSFDIVGVSLNQFDPGDASAPPAPGGLTLAARVGAVEMQWNGVIAADLAGYAIYYSDKTFVNPGSAGVKQLNYLEGGTRHLLSGVSGTVFVAVSALDLSGNESAISSVESTAVIAGDGPVLELLAGSTEGIVGEPITLTASGSPAFDWDLDGDGTFEVTGDVSGSQIADTGKAGIIRPAVRGSDGSTAVALGAVSLIVASDLPPVAILTANRTKGAIIDGGTNPLNVQFDGGNSYDDGPTLDYSFSPLGDGNYSTPSSNANYNQGYSSSGQYTAMMRIEDSSGQQALALLPIRVEQVTGFKNYIVYPGYNSGVYGCMAVVAGRPAVLFRKFGPTPDDDGLFYSRALDDGGRLWGEPVKLADNNNYGDYFDLAVIAGNPAIAWYKFSANKVFYRRASSSTGQTLSDWNNPGFEISGVLSVSDEVRLMEVSGNPAVIWTDGSDIKYVRATGGSGTGDFAGDWTDAPFNIVAASSIGSRPDFAMIAGNPAIAYWNFSTNEACYVRATSASGSSALDWPATPVVVDGSDTCTGRVNLLQVNGAPAISFFDSADDSDIHYTRATTATGTDTADWPVAVSVNHGFGSGNTWHDMAIISGRPAIAYADYRSGAATSYRRANDANGSSWGDPMRVGSNIDYNDSMYERVDLEDLNGFPVVYNHYQSWDRGVVSVLESEL